MKNYQHIIVGGGVSGMTAALLLAKQGKKTALVEAFPVLAPTIRGFNRRGVHFETGVHLLGGLGERQPLDIYFRHLGISEDLKKIPFEPDGYDCFRYEQTGREIRMPIGYKRLRSTLCSAFPKEATAVKTYLDKIKSIFDSSPYLNFEKSFSLESIVHTETGTLQEFLDSITDNQQLKDLLCYHTLLYGTTPEEAMLATHALVAGSYFTSSHTVEGGGLAIVKSFQNRLGKAGVDIYTGHKVSLINSGSDKSFKSVILSDKTELAAKSCIWTAHPAGLIDCTPDDAFRPVFRRRIKELQESPSAIALFGTAGEPIKELQRKNIYLWPGGRYSEILSGQTDLADNAIFISANQSLSGNGKQTISAIAPYSFAKFKKWADSDQHNRPAQYLEFKSRIIHRFEQEVFKRCPELRGRVEFIDSATPLTIKDYCSTPYGSMYGAAHTVSQYNPLPMTKIKGLLLAGQSILAPGILGAVVSAYLACGISCGHDKIHEELRCIYNG
ncbi:phytoene desaturase family protein [Maridesulfovibrio hydrothermalis]|uniref:All-trans-retinol 13,14-reductase n=1 Tax=Maridesulfovibrio hydrothermalis AM13 = DSM 14728 TaxID=1121451 RepID=L0RB88_9BACT|nr:FAD-dependent oxidoreductase [Maridesulfovibrio hydrothermalis]CCO23435.1 All-trans-retinol 13,14-reductase [Maridesulfovibrio hydrothermalis AM13 = DSM 14728]